MKINLVGHDDDYSVYTMLKCFFPFEKLIKTENEKDNNFCISTKKTTKNSVVSIIQIKYLKQEVTIKKIMKISDLSLDKNEQSKQIKNLIKRNIYTAAKKIIKTKFEWGILTGIRPAKLVRELLLKNSKQECIEILSKEYLVSMTKIRMLFDIVDIEGVIISDIKCKDVSLYISIPFCKTRCSYCSFVSHSIEKAGHLIDDYILKLVDELSVLSGFIKEKSLNIKSVYIGGGTPTALNEQQLFILLSELEKNFDLSNVLEYTLEAGRADTITKEKLLCAKKFGVKRISINPQTMNDEILNELGRNHTSDDVVLCFNMAKEVGFDNINMDIIAGLPNETLKSYKNTIDKVLMLNPQSITIHTLSMKKGSKIGQNNKDLETQYKCVSNMLSYSSEKLSKLGYKPYYMYRQKSILGNLENVGYSKPGFEGLYNIYIMEEVMSILAIGAGAVSKIISDGNKIDRVFNYKYPYEYINDTKKIDKNIEILKDLFHDKIKNQSL